MRKIRLLAGAAIVVILAWWFYAINQRIHEFDQNPDVLVGAAFGAIIMMAYGIKFLKEGFSKTV